MTGRMIRVAKWVSMLTTGLLLAGGAGSCLPQNFWAGVAGYTIVDALIAAARNTVLVTLGLQTP